MAIQAPAIVAANVTLTLPADDGSSGESLITDGSGVLSWSSPSAGGGWTDGADIILTVETDLVGIGDGTPSAKLEVDVGNTENDIALLIDQNDTTNNPVALEIQNAGSGDSLLIDTSALVVSGAGKVGIGYADPGAVAELAVNGQVGIGTTNPSGSLEVVGPVFFNTVSVSDEEFHIGDDGSSDTVISIENDYSLTSYIFEIHVQDDNVFRITDAAESADYLTILGSNGNFGINDRTLDARLDVIQSGNTVAIFNRTTSDGTIIELQQAGTTEGTISVSGSTVSYNAFTGSHYAWTDEEIGPGTLVSLTGKNRNLHGDPHAEIIYGIVPSNIANDPKILGAYLGLEEPGESKSLDNPHLVMAVGNGTMWVVDNGENIDVGDYLISSHVSGHAMKDRQDYDLSYVVARAAEPVDWINVDENINGLKHKKISVFFESFVKNNALRQLKLAAVDLERLKAKVDQLETKIQELRNQ